MARSTANRGVLPWPSRFTCDDGETRNLAKFISSEWADHPAVVGPSATGRPPGDGRGGDLVFMSHRIRAARSLGRSGLQIISAMSGRHLNNGRGKK
jgi:hypothetical protein